MMMHFLFLFGLSLNTQFSKISDSPNTGQGYNCDTVSSGGAKLRFWIGNNYWGTKYIQVVGSTAIVNTDGFYHVVYTYDGSGNRSAMKIYLNGVAETLTESGATTLSDTIVTSENLQIGRNVTTKYFSGNMGPIAMYNRVLSTDEILKSYNQLKNRFQ